VDTSASIRFPKSAFYYTTMPPTYRYNKQSIGDQQYCSAVFLDVSQAFNKAWHQGLLLKIKQTLLPVYFNFLKSYLQNRNFVKTYKNETSPPFQCSRVSPSEAIWGLYYIRYTQQMSHNPTQQSSTPLRTTRLSSQLIQILP